MSHVHTRTSRRLRGARAEDPYPPWFIIALVLLVAAASVGLARTQVFVLAVGLAMLASRDLWQAVLTLALSSLTLATTGARVSLSQPFILRFLLLAALVMLLLARYRVSIDFTDSRTVFRGLLPLSAFSLWAFVASQRGDFATTGLEATLAAAITFAVPITAALSRWRDRAMMANDLHAVARFLWIFTAVGVGLALSDGLLNRSSGLHANPNTFAFMAGLGFGLSLGLRALARRAVGSAMVATFSLGVLLSGSRGALAGIVLAMSYLVARRASRRPSRNVLLASGAVTIVLLLAPVPQPLDIGSAFTRTFGGEELDLAGRQDRWQDMQVLISQRPITGHGLRASREALDAASGLGLTETAGAHNSYLTVVAETGIVGALLLLLVVLSALRPGPPSDRTGRLLWLAASGAVLTGLGHMLGESFVLGVGSPFPLLFWTGVILLLALRSRDRAVRPQ